MTGRLKLRIAAALALASAQAAGLSAERVHPKSHLVEVSRGKGPAGPSCEIRYRLIPSEGLDPRGLMLYLGVSDDSNFLALGVEGEPPDQKLTLRRVENGTSRTIASGAAPVFTAGVESSLYVRLRGSDVLVHDGARRLVEARGVGRVGGRCGVGPCKKVAFRAPLVQPVGRIAFSDDFMRDRALGCWKRHGGPWAVSYVPHSGTSVQTFNLSFGGKEPGTVSSGGWFWSDYVASVSVRADAHGGSVGLGFYWRSPGDYFVLRCTGAGEPAGRVELVRVSRVGEKVLGGLDAALRPGQWYRLKVIVQGDVAAAFIDDSSPVAVVRNRGLTGGRVALTASGARATFDDVIVEGLSMPPGDLEKGTGEAVRRALARAEGDSTSVTRIFSERPTMREWATATGRWQRRGAFDWCPTVFHGPVTFSWRPSEPMERGLFSLAIRERNDAVRGDADAKVRALVSLDPGLGCSVASVRAGGEVVARRKLAPGALGGVSVDVAEKAVEIGAGGPGAVRAPLGGHPGGITLGYRAFGYEGASSVEVRSPNLFDYTFARSPSDWIHSCGDWKLHVRWTCDPRWSWFGGRNESGPAWLWNKRCFAGDVSAEAYCAFMMLRPGWPGGYGHPFNVRLAICANATEPDSGYTLVYGNVDGPSMILRKGKVVARSEKYVEKLYPMHNSTRVERVHRRWLHVQAVRRGASVRLYVDRELLLEYTDPEPLAGELVGFGTERNGLSLARVIISAERPGGKRLFLAGGEK